MPPARQTQAWEWLPRTMTDPVARRFFAPIFKASFTLFIETSRRLAVSFSVTPATQQVLPPLVGTGWGGARILWISNIGDGRTYSLPTDMLYVIPVPEISDASCQC